MNMGPGIKRIICLSMTMIMLIFAAVPAFANESVDSGFAVLNNDLLSNAEISTDSNQVYLTQITDLGDNHYVKETVVLVPKEDTTPGELVNMIRGASGGTAQTYATGYTEEYDSSISVCAWIYVYYNKTTKALGEAVRITGVAGGYSIDDNTVRVNGQTVIYGQSGKNAETGYAVSGENATKYPSSSSWSYSAPSWSYVLTDVYPCNVGGNVTTTLQRMGGSSTWSFTVSCTVASY